MSAYRLHDSHNSRIIAQRRLTMFVHSCLLCITFRPDCMQHVNRARRELPFVSFAGENARLFPLEIQSSSIQRHYRAVRWHGIEFSSGRKCCERISHVYICTYGRHVSAYILVRSISSPESHAGGSVNDEVQHMYRMGKSIMLGHVTRTLVSVALRISLAAKYTYICNIYVYLCVYACVYTREIFYLARNIQYVREIAINLTADNFIVGFMVILRNGWNCNVRCNCNFTQHELNRATPLF